MPKRDLHQEITDKLVAKLEAGTVPWRCPWEAGGTGVHPLRHNGERYRGINVLMLWCAAQDRGFQSSYWMTFKQAKEMGAQVIKGAKSEEVVYVGKITRERDEIDPATGQPIKASIPFLKSYRVFNVGEIEGLPEHYYGKPTVRHEWEGIAGADRFFDAIGADIQYGGHRAFFRPSTDHIQMPERDTFRTAAGFYSTLAHELTHWTGARKRLNRDMDQERAKYAFEELVAELGAAFTCATLGTPLELDQNAAYLASWIKALRNDKRAIFRAATLAEAAVSYLVDQAEKRLEPVAA